MKAYPNLYPLCASGSLVVRERERERAMMCCQLNFQDNMLVKAPNMGVVLRLTIHHPFTSPVTYMQSRIHRPFGAAAPWTDANRRYMSERLFFCFVFVCLLCLHWPVSMEMFFPGSRCGLSGMYLILMPVAKEAWIRLREVGKSLPDRKRTR